MDKKTITVYARIFGVSGPILSITMGLSFQDYSEFRILRLWKVSHKMLNLPVYISLSNLFSGYLKTIWAVTWDFHQCGISASKASDQPAHMNSLIRAFASCLNILWHLGHWPNTFLELLSLKEAAQARPSLHLSKCHIVGNHMSWLNFIIRLEIIFKGIFTYFKLLEFIVKDFVNFELSAMYNECIL